jgi:hypothetical protein
MNILDNLQSGQYYKVDMRKSGKGIHIGKFMNVYVHDPRKFIFNFNELPHTLYNPNLSAELGVETSSLATIDRNLIDSVERIEDIHSLFQELENRLSRMKPGKTYAITFKVFEWDGRTRTYINVKTDTGKFIRSTENFYIFMIDDVERQIPHDSIIDIQEINIKQMFPLIPEGIATDIEQQYLGG